MTRLEHVALTIGPWHLEQFQLLYLIAAVLLVPCILRDTALSGEEKVRETAIDARVAIDKHSKRMYHTPGGSEKVTVNDVERGNYRDCL